MAKTHMDYVNNSLWPLSVHPLDITS